MRSNNFRNHIIPFLIILKCMGAADEYAITKMGARWQNPKAFHSGFHKNDQILSNPLSSDDPYEDNDDFESAYTILPGNYSGLQADEDWYKFEVAINQGVNLELKYNSSAGYISMNLVSDENVVIIYGDHNGDSVTIYYPNLIESQTLYCQVLGDNNNLTYILNFSLINTDDRYEDNDMWSSAPEIWTGFQANLVYMQGDDDWFMIYEDGSKMVNFTLIYNQSLGILNMDFWDSSENALNNVYFSENGTKYTVVVPDIGYYYLHIWGTGNYIPYGINFTHHMEDRYEINNNCSQAATIEFSGITDVTDLYLLDPDWYMVSIPQFYLFDMHIEFTEFPQSISISFYNRSSINECNPLQYYSYESYGNTVSYNFGPFPHETTLIFGIQAVEYSDVQYSLVLNLEPAQDDFWEENDDLLNAGDISNEIEDNNLFLFPFDEDWYKIDTHIEDTGRRMIVNISTCFLVEDFQIEITDTMGTTLLNLTQVNNTYFGSVDLYFEREILLRIYSNSDIIVRYSLEINFINIGKFPYEDPFGMIPGFPLWPFFGLTTITIGLLSKCLASTHDDLKNRKRKK